MFFLKTVFNINETSSYLNDENYEIFEDFTNKMLKNLAKTNKLKRQN